LCVSSLIARPHHDTNFPNVRGERLLDEDAENGLFNSIVDKSLQREGTLIRSRRSDDRFPDPQFGCSPAVTSQRSGQIGWRLPPAVASLSHDGKHYTRTAAKRRILKEIVNSRIST
jgi:hypothetical protein